MGRNAELGIYRNSGETSGVVGFTLENEPVGVRFVVDRSSKQEHALLAVGTQLGNNSYLIGGLSIGRETIPGYDAKMTGKSALIRFDMSELTPALRKVFVDALYQDTSDKRLSVTDTAFSDSVITSNSTGYTTTVTSGIDRTTTQFYGGKRFTLRLGASANIGSDGVLTVTVRHDRSKLLGQTTSQTEGVVDYTHYLSRANANLGISAATSGRVSVGGEKMLSGTPISLFANVYADVKGSKLSSDFAGYKSSKEMGVYVGLRYHFGDEKHNLGARPQSAQAQLNDTLSHLYPPRNYFGTVQMHTERLVGSVTSTDTVEEKPIDPPVLLPVIDAVDDALQTIIAGQSGATSVLANDTLDGAAVSAANVNVTQLSSSNPGVTLNASTGIVSVAAGTPAGTYTVTYQICDKANPTNCNTAKASVEVVAPPPPDLSVEVSASSPFYTPFVRPTITYYKVKNISQTPTLGPIVLTVTTPAFTGPITASPPAGWTVNKVGFVYTFTTKQVWYSPKI